MSKPSPSFMLQTLRSLFTSFKRSHEIAPKWWEVQGLMLAFEDLDNHLKQGGELPDDWKPRPSSTPLLKFETELEPRRFAPPNSASVLYGVVQINGVAHHSVLVRVKWEDRGGGTFREQVAADDPTSEFMSFDSFEGPFDTISVPGHEGEWVLLIHPFGG